MPLFSLVASFFSLSLKSFLCLSPVFNPFFFCFFLIFFILDNCRTRQGLFTMQEKAIYLSALYLFLPSCCHSVPREENALSHSLYLLVVGLMLEEPERSTGCWWWQIDHWWMGVMGILTLPFTRWELEESIKQKVRAIGDYRHLPDRLRRDVCSGICTFIGEPCLIVRGNWLGMCLYARSVVMGRTRAGLSRIWWCAVMAAGRKQLLLLWCNDIWLFYIG